MAHAPIKARAQFFFISFCSSTSTAFMSMLQLFITLLALSNIVTRAYSNAVVDESTPGSIDNSTSLEVERSLGENVTVINSTDDKPREAGGPSSLPLYQPYVRR